MKCRRNTRAKLKSFLSPRSVCFDSRISLFHVLISPTACIFFLSIHQDQIVRSLTAIIDIRLSYYYVCSTRTKEHDRLEKMTTGVSRESSKMLMCQMHDFPPITCCGIEEYRCRPHCVRLSSRCSGSVLLLLHHQRIAFSPDPGSGQVLSKPPRMLSYPALFNAYPAPPFELYGMVHPQHPFISSAPTFRLNFPLMPSSHCPPALATCSFPLHPLTTRSPPPPFLASINPHTVFSVWVKQCQ